MIPVTKVPSFHRGLEAVMSRLENLMDVNLFNSAYKLAWDHLQADPELLAKPSGLAKRLRD